MRLHELSERPGAAKGRKRVGRGPGSGSGKSCGRGMKGQKSRSGAAIKGFEGGQMPIHRRMPKRGFTNNFSRDLAAVNVGTIQVAIDSGRLDAGKTITLDALVKCGCVRRNRQGVRILGKGTLDVKVTVEASGVSEGARAAIEKAGGGVIIVPEPADSAGSAGKDAPGGG